MERIWGTDGVKNFFGHVCPALYAYETLAYWPLIKNVHPAEFTAMIEHMTQVVINLSNEQGRTFLTVKKGGRRYLPSTYKQREYLTDGLAISFKWYTIRARNEVLLNPSVCAHAFNFKLPNTHSKIVNETIP